MTDVERQKQEASNLANHWRRKLTQAYTTRNAPRHYGHRSFQRNWILKCVQQVRIWERKLDELCGFNPDGTWVNPNRKKVDARA